MILTRHAALNALTGLLQAADETKLVNELVSSRNSLFGDEAIVSVLMPARSEDVLECRAVSGPFRASDDLAEIRKRAAVPYGSLVDRDSRVIAAHVYEHKEKWPTPDDQPDSQTVLEDAGRRGLRKHEWSAGVINLEIDAVYAVPLVSRDKKECYGVIQAEAPKNVLRYALHMPVLEQLADVAARMIEHFRATERLTRDASESQKALSQIREGRLTITEWWRIFRRPKLEHLRMGAAIGIAGILCFCVLWMSSEYHSRLQLQYVVAAEISNVKNHVIGVRMSNPDGPDLERELRKLDQLDQKRMQLELLISDGVYQLGDTAEEIRTGIQASSSIRTDAQTDLHDPLLARSPTQGARSSGVWPATWKSSLLLGIAMLSAGGLGAILAWFIDRTAVLTELIATGMILGIIGSMSLLATHLLLMFAIGVDPMMSATRIPTANVYFDVLIAILLGMHAPRVESGVRWLVGQVSK